MNQVDRQYRSTPFFSLPGYRPGNPKSGQTGYPRAQRGTPGATGKLADLAAGDPLPSIRQRHDMTRTERFTTPLHRSMGVWLPALAAVAIAAYVANNPPVPSRPLPHKTDWSQVGLKDPDMEARWGVRVLDLRTTAGGYMLDFRYRLFDADKAAPVLDKKVIPYLIHETSGAQLMVPSPPMIGPLRQTARQIEAQRNYFILFANPGQMVKPGDKVTVVIGDFRAEHVSVK